MAKRMYRLNKALREALAYLGSDYVTKVIDRELCLYRDLGNGRDIEVSGLRSETQRGSICNFICAWYTPDGNVYVRSDKHSDTKDSRHRPLRNLADLKRALDALVIEYG